MMSKRVWIATALSCFLALATIASCDMGEDCCTGTASGTSLSGPYDCGANTCGSGEVCVRFYGGVDAGSDSQPSAYCMSPAPLCAVEDCGGYSAQVCSPCIEQLCYERAYVSVVGRDVSCGGA